VTPRQPHYWPLPRSVILALFVATVLVVSTFLVNVMSYAYQRVGLGQGWAFATLLASVFGSWFNIPVARLAGTTTVEPTLVRVRGMLYVVPRPVRAGAKIVAVNVGGAVVPTVLATYLIVANAFVWQAAAAITVVGIVTHQFARVVRGVGIVVPTVVPPLAAVLIAWVLHVEAVAALAYVGGTLGTLIGADLLNLNRVRDVDAPVLSIGGAGTFDGIFVTGIVAVLLAAL
jgi:uncharacterized membrane protein